MKKLIPSLLLAAAATVGCATDDALIPPPELEVKEDAELGEVLYLNGLPLLPLSQHQFMSQEIFPSLFVNRTVLPGEENPCPGSKHYLYLNVGPVNQFEQRDYDRRNHYAYYFPDLHQALAERYPTGYIICPSYDPTIQTEQSTQLWRLIEASRKFSASSTAITVEYDEFDNIVIIPATPHPAYAEAEALLRDCTPLFTTLKDDPENFANTRETWLSFYEYMTDAYTRLLENPEAGYYPRTAPDQFIRFSYGMDLLLKMDVTRCLGNNYWVVNNGLYLR